MEDIEYYIQLCSRLTLQNKSLGFFKDLLERVSPFINLIEFSYCNTDLERILFCTQRCWQLIGAELIFRCKNNEEAVAKRLEGNVAFSEGDFEKALLLFSQSIIKSPPGNDLALAYANRSAVLQKLKEWQLAIYDIELAFSYNYPQETRHKLYERMTSCHIKLRNYTQAKIVVGLCNHYLTKYSISDKQYSEKLAKHLTNIEAQTNKDVSTTTKTTQKKNNKDYGDNDNEVSSDKNNLSNGTFPTASIKMEVKYSYEGGRYFATSEQIQPGELILQEEPFAKALLPERMGSYCSHCFKKLRAAVACEVCANVAFCSKSCRQHADKYHRYECRIFSLLIGSGMSVLPFVALRMITQSSAEELISNSERLVSRPDEVILDSDVKYTSTKYETIYNLVALESQRQPQDFLERTIMAIFLIKCLRLVGYFDINLFKNPDPTPTELQVGALLLRNLQILQFNAYEITDYIIDSTKNFKKASSRNIGLGLYSTAAFFNHSCSPNVTRYFNGTKMTVISTQVIEPGQPIYDNYGPLFTKMSKKERQYKLQGRYWFQCSCEACLNDWPTYENMPVEILPKTEEEKINLKKLQKLDDLFYEDGLKAMENGKEVEAVKNLTNYLVEIDSVIKSSPSFKPYRTFYLTQDALRLCLPAVDNK